MILALAIGVVLAALFFTLFVRPKDVPEPLPVSPVQHLEDRKHAIYDNLRDLQFEYRLGKLSDEDYQQTKQALHKELAGVLADIEETLNRLGLPSTRTAAAKPAASKPVPAAAAAFTCNHCGASFAQPLRFCGECGKPMHEEVRL
jgi:NADH pyrophosphatase NudC (nudix superfamily)